MIPFAAPGKLIISGEHAVVYGQPALAAAISYFAECVVQPLAGDDIQIELPQFNLTKTTNFDLLMFDGQRLGARYSDFKKGNLPIREVLQSPLELVEYTLSALFERLGVLPAGGFKLTISSEVPVSCGLGSSAAVIVSILTSALEHLGMDIGAEALFSLALEIEHLQHGKSSGVDVFMSLNGGCVEFRKSANADKAEFEKVTIGSFPVLLVDTGKPECSTGDSVTKVAADFKDSSIWPTFAAVTKRVRKALETENLSALKSTLSENHQLLCEIGVVPKRVREFVRFVEAEGGAAKITGAGAVRGDGAGMAIVVADSDVDFAVKKFGYSLRSVRVEARGVHRVAADAR